jgi:hypothetical protein
MLKVFGFIAACVVCISAETHITGNIEGTIFDPSGNPYFVEQDVVVPAGKTAAIKEGCVFLFKNYTGIRVDGKLTVEGTAAKPVVFTSINDGDYNTAAEQLPNSFDWNGIVVSRECQGAYLKNFILKFSVYGIKSQNQNIQIESGVFNQNGQYHFTINDKVQDVKDNLPYSFNVSGMPAGDKNDSKTSSGKGAASKGAAEKPSLGKQVIRYSCLGIGVIGVGLGIVYAVQTSNASKEMDKYDIQKGGIPDSDAWSAASASHDSNRTGTILSLIAGGAGLVGFGLTFAF